MKITVVGLGYVGLSNAVLLAQNNEVFALDILENKVSMVNKKKSPIKDLEIEDFLRNRDLDLTATTNYEYAVKDSEFALICTPTDYDSDSNFFDTSTVEGAIKKVLAINPTITIIIKSTVPVGFTNNMKEIFAYNNIIFSPEFLREGKALHDNLYPSRVVIGSKTKKAKLFSELLIKGSKKENIPVVYTDSTEAEAIKLFANTYLAMRVAFFNELDSFAEIRGLDSEQIIEGISRDPRIGNHYNNPSFGYGGYCLPKDTKQLLATYRDVPNNIMTAVVKANQTRKFHIAEMVLKREPKKVGIFGLAMKSNSDNFRETAIQGVIEILLNNNIEIVIYEPLISEKDFNGLKIIRNLEEFKKLSDIILANRFTEELNDVQHKLYTRDIFTRD